MILRTTSILFRIPEIVEQYNKETTRLSKMSCKSLSVLFFRASLIPRFDPYLSSSDVDMTTEISGSPTIRDTIWVLTHHLPLIDMYNIVRDDVRHMSLSSIINMLSEVTYLDTFLVDGIKTDNPSLKPLCF